VRGGLATDASSTPKLRIATAGFSPHEWPSINRTRAFYNEALLGMASSLVEIDGRATADSVPANVDLLLNYSGNVGWDLSSRARSFPIAFCMHGGCVLTPEFIRENMASLSGGDTLIVNCRSDEQLLNDMVDVAGPHVDVLPLPVDTERFFPEGREAARDALSIGPHDFCIGVVARLLPQKNVHGALEVIREAVRLNPQRHVRILIVGNFWTNYRILHFDGPPYSARLRQLIEDYGLADDVTYLPAKLTDDELAQAYRACDVLLHPTNSIDENFGYAPIEAMASGVPVVGCAYGGLKDTVIDGETGFLAPTWLSLGGLREDRGALVDGLCALMRDDDLRRRMSAQARSHAVLHFSSAHCSVLLQRIVVQACHRWHGVPGEVTRTRPGADHSTYDKHLRPRHDRLSQYVGSILHYVSGERPGLYPGLHVQRYSEFEAYGAGIRLTNPAWPAEYALSPRQRDLLDATRAPVSVASLTARHELEDIERALDLGLLITSRPVH